MENSSLNSVTLQIEGLEVSETVTYPVFFFFLFSYMFILILNGGILVLICVDKSLHQPMYLLLSNMLFNDIFGNSMLMPRLLFDLLRPRSKRLLSYYECMVQAFISHTYGTTSHTVLMIMAFDRYEAICNPLSYTAVMTGKMVVKLTLSAWGGALVPVVILLGLTIRLSWCRTLITNPYCDNPSLFKLSCESVEINNIYGLMFTVVLFTASISSIILTYAHISVVCLTKNNRSLNRKALMTCSTHLFVYIILLFSGMVIILLHRFPQFSYERKVISILYHIIPGSLNPIIYGVQSKEIQKFVSQRFCSQKVLSSF